MTYRSLDLTEYRAASGLDLGRGVATGTLSPVQLAECALALIAEHEPVVNAYAAVLADRARTEAVARETEAAAGRLRSPLHGVPLAVKDNMLLAGQPTGKGSLTTSDAPAVDSSPAVQRLLDAGAVVVGTTTTPEFGWKGTGLSPRTGVTRNPWDPSRGSGGSSAGSAATLATGAVPLALGSDAGGSIRIPAAFCGVVGLKPTLGAVPVWPGTVNETLSHAGPLARTVADVRAMLRIVRGPDPRDPQSYYSRPPAAEVGRRLRVAVVRAPFGIAPLPEVAAVVDPVLAALVGGALEPVASAEEVDLPAALPRAVFETMWVTGRGLGFRELTHRHGDRMDPGLVRLGPLAEAYSLADYYAATTARRDLTATMAAFLSDWDLVVMPTMPLTAFAAEAEVPPDGRIGEAGAPLPWITWTPYTYPFNITGQPALTLPCGRASDGLPVGLQIVGPWAHDERVLDLAAACERLLGRTPDSSLAPRPTSTSAERRSDQDGDAW
ncbi:MAG TPA: amidase family protein [Cellulomonas sp.]